MISFDLLLLLLPCTLSSILLLSSFPVETSIGNRFAILLMLVVSQTSQSFVCFVLMTLLEYESVAEFVITINMIYFIGIISLSLSV